MKSKRVKIKCKFCDKEFEVTPCEIKRNRKFCSRKCFAKSRIGSKHTEEWKEKMRQMNLGPNNHRYGKKASEKTRKKMRKSHKGLNTWSKNRPLTEEHKRKIRKSCKGINAGENNGMFGRVREKCPTWIDGRSFEPYSPEFNDLLKEQIRLRDNYRCQQCFRHQEELFSKKGKHYKLHIHHIDYNKRNNNPNNLISLCRNCHAQTNFNREDWTIYFKNKLKNYGKN